MVQSQLQPDPNQETAALLRVLIYKIDNATFGGEVPVLPQWTGPPRTIIKVQGMLYASLVTSLLSAFLAMLGKQWLNRYVSVDMRGSAIERSQNRQRKLDGIVAWYFDYVMESLPLMLQVALWLLGCALSKYLWEIDTAVASVVVAVTSFGALFYFFIVVAGTTSDSCPYQVPATNVIRRIPGLLRSTRGLLAKNSEIYDMSDMWWGDVSSRSVVMIFITILLYPFMLLLTFPLDAFRLVRATFRALAASLRWTRRWSQDVALAQNRFFGSQGTELDFRCISWMLQTSLDKVIKVSTLNFLLTILPFTGLDSSINSVVIINCLDVLSSCLVTIGHEKMIARGSEQLAKMSAMSFLRAFSCLLSTEPTSSVIKNVRHRYERVFPRPCEVHGISSPFIMDAIHCLLASPGDQPKVDWRDYNPSVDELVPFSRVLARAAYSQFARQRARKDPYPNGYHWLIRFALRFLSQDPPPPISVTLDCLTIIAIDLGCDSSRAHDMSSAET